MRLPLIKNMLDFVESHDEDYLIETAETLEHLTEVPSLKDSELDAIGEVISTIYGALEVKQMMDKGIEKKDALNRFMQRVLGSIGK